jgi:signal peptidase I
MAAEKDLRGTWPQALMSLACAILLILGIRWALFEPYVIPSGSMIPTLLVHDHILVNKFSFGIRVPFTSDWLMHFSRPKRGDVLVFRSVGDDGTFLVKRVVGLPGDQLSVAENGQVFINSKPIPRRVLTDKEAAAVVATWPEDSRSNILSLDEFIEETLDGKPHIALRERDTRGRVQESIKIPDDSLFMMGDNRDESSDSRVWGTLPLDRVLGRASWIWLSCEETLAEMNQLCDPKTMRWDRIMKGIR